MLYAFEFKNTIILDFSPMLLVVGIVVVPTKPLEQISPVAYGKRYLRERSKHTIETKKRKDEKKTPETE